MNAESIELAILAQSALGAYTQTRLLWPKHLALPKPGEHLQLHNGECLYPMFSPCEGQLEVLSQRAPSSLNRAALTGIGLTQNRFFLPLPLAGEGRGEGTSLAQINDLSTYSPSPQPSPQRGEGAKSAFLRKSYGTSIQPALDEPIVILAHGIELATLIYICSQRRNSAANTLALYQLDDPAPFRPRPSRFLLPDMPHGVIAAIPLLEDWGIPSRLCSTETRAGCFEGSLDELLKTLNPKSKHTVIHLNSLV
ncbi:MAG: hypothetical protein AB7S56_08100 [Halothiobacillaceae bacterium]